jgi:hypothetical protein
MANMFASVWAARLPCHRYHFAIMFQALFISQPSTRERAWALPRQDLLGYA